MIPILTLLTCFLFANVYSQAEYEFYEQDEVQENFEIQLEKFIEVFNGKNLNDLDDYISSDLGFFILDNPGAFINANYYKSFEPILQSNSSYDLFRMKDIVIRCNPEKGKLPVYICDEWDREEGWDKEGCYYDNFNVSKFRPIFSNAEGN